MPVSIYDIAKETGVSISTVSKALNDSYSISEATKQRIRAAAKEMGYVPNARATSFAKKRNGLIVLVANFYRGIGFDNPHLFEIITGIECYLEEKGYLLVIKNVDKDTAPDIVRELLDSKSADGVIMHAGIVSRQLASMVLKEEYSHLVIGKPDFPSRLSWIDVSHETAGEIAAEYLLNKGYKDIVFMMGDSLGDGISARRFDGFIGPIEEAGLIVSTVEDIISYEEARLATKEIVGRKKLPDVILCANNHLAMGCIQATREKKVNVPEDMAIMTFDNYPFSSITKPTLTAVEVDMYEMGVQAARFIIQKINKPNLQTQSFCTTPIIIERESS